MTSLTIVGGLYRERCIWPNWDRVYGSGGRAAEAASSHVDTVIYKTYATPDAEAVYRPTAELAGIDFQPLPARQRVSFSYIHSLSPPLIEPAPTVLLQEQAIEVDADAVLRFGMLEGSARVKAKRCVYDPQSGFAPSPFHQNGSTAEALAIVGNQKEIVALAQVGIDPLEAAKALLDERTQVVVIKAGVGGATVVDPQGCHAIPAFQTGEVFKIGSGDVFAAMFAAMWGAHARPAIESAYIASRAVADYVDSMDLPQPLRDSSDGMIEAKAIKGRVFIAGSFSNMGQRWVVDEARRCLLELGLTVASPLHDAGVSDAAQAQLGDVDLLTQCDRVFAVLDGVDNRALFATGWASAKGLPVYLFAQSASEEDLRTPRSTDCRIFDDFVTALYHTAWRT